MYCWNCHQEISDNSKFCIHCGADLRQGAAPAAAQPPQAQSGAAYTAEPIQTGPAVTAQATPKKRFNWKAILLAVLVFFAARFIGQAVGKSMASSGSSKPSSSSSSKPQDDLSQAVANAQQDLITLHNVYVFPDQGDGYRVFVIVYYGSDTHSLTDITVEYVYEKSSGYTLDGIKSADFSSAFPSFAELSYSEDQNYVIFTSKMKNLKNAQRIQALVEKDLLVLDEPGSKPDVIDADSYMQSFLDSGWQEASYQDYSILHFN